MVFAECIAKQATKMRQAYNDGAGKGSGWRAPTNKGGSF